MAEEGMDFYYTPLSAWLSHTLHRIHKNGGKPVLLAQHEAQKEKTTNDLITRLENLNSTGEWQ